MARPRFCLFGVVIVLSQCCFALLVTGQITYPVEVTALQAIRKKFNDPRKNLNNWKRTDPCVSKWTGVLCTLEGDGYFHVQELRLLRMNLSGTLAPELGQLSYTTILNLMWNNISGCIPKEIANMNSLQLLLLSGNQISGPLPDELGDLPNLTNFQVDINYISGPLPKSFAKLSNVQHFHMSNNSISGQIPPELSELPQLVHFLLDNNNLSGYLPPELSKMPKLKILQIDNNNFNGTGIPDSYGSMSNLLKLSLRNCRLQGPVPDLSSIPGLLFLDLSSNQFTGSIPTNKLSDNITTIDLSYNKLNGSIPSNFSCLPNLQRLSLENNSLSGDVPTNFWQNMTFRENATLTLDFQNNSLSNISSILEPPSSVSIKLQGNPVCTRANELNIKQLCGPQTGDTEPSRSSYNWDEYFESSECRPESLRVGLYLRSPRISDFPPYSRDFKAYITSSLGLDLCQLVIDSFKWQEGYCRLSMYLKIFSRCNITAHTLNASELQQIVNLIANFTLPTNDAFGPYDLTNFKLVESCLNGMSKWTILGIVLGAIFCIVAILAIAIVFYKRHTRNQLEASRSQPSPRIPIKIKGVKEFSFLELQTATNRFCDTTQVGQGGYGKVYKGILADGTVVAIKRAQQRSLQGEKEFFTEIQLLSCLHHRNLVSLLGYCDEEGEQMLVYEFMLNGSLRNLLSARFKRLVSFAMRLQIALDSAKGIRYLHTEADPPIIHRDIKANNILLDSKHTAKVSDFGISRLAPVQDHEGVVTHVSTVVKGTPGYLDPEYFLTHKLTVKSDVYSLGIVFLELLTGMQPISHGRHIARKVNAACQSGIMFSIIDQNMGIYPSECAKKFMELALKCCQDEPVGRPSMLKVVRELENISLKLQESNTMLSESEATTSGMSEVDSSSLYDRRKPFVSSDFLGSDLISDVMPTIRPC